MPLLIRGLDLPDHDIQANIINTLADATEGNPEESSIMAEHASTLVSTMLKNTMFHEMPSVVSEVILRRNKG
jgi:DNA repair/transcription protein MET18/MMS19